MLDQALLAIWIVLAAIQVAIDLIDLVTPWENDPP